MYVSCVYVKCICMCVRDYFVDSLSIRSPPPIAQLLHASMSHVYVCDCAV